MVHCKKNNNDDELWTGETFAGLRACFTAGTGFFGLRIAYCPGTSWKNFQCYLLLENAGRHR